MNIPYFGLVIIFVVWLSYELHKSRRKNEKASEDFWEREIEAGSVRRQSTDDIKFICFDTSVLPLDRGEPDSELESLCDRIEKLSVKKIADLSAYTNTDLKMKYGVANFQELSEADTRFTSLTPLVGNLCNYLYENNRSDEAMKVSEYAINIGIHTSVVMLTLAKIHKDRGESQKIASLLAIAKEDEKCPASLIEKLNGFL